MHCPLLQPSWIEQTMDLCDQILMKAAKANPTNRLLISLASRIKPSNASQPESAPRSTSQPLAS